MIAMKNRLKWVRKPVTAAFDRLLETAAIKALFKIC